MKLTKSDKEAFVKAVMNDVPFTDYNEIAQSIVKKRLLDKAPEAVRQAYEQHPEYFEIYYVMMPGELSNFYAAPLTNNARMDGDDLTDLTELSDKADEQACVRSGLEEKVKALIGGCSTLKQAKERLPEFTEYLPAERDGTGVINLPVIANIAANIAAELAAAGWPKDAAK